MTRLRIFSSLKSGLSAAFWIFGVLVSCRTVAAQGTYGNITTAVLSKSEAAAEKNSLDSPFAAFRIGIIASPIASIDGGLDVTFPRLKISEQWVSRLDFDFAARFNSPSFGSRRDASFGLTFCQVYTPGGVNRGRWYGGAGLGYFFGPRSALGGKVFVGTNFTRVVSLEVEGQFPGDSTTRAVLMLRLSAL
jgi:hypothetical protein